MHKAWPELLKRMKAGKASTSSKDRQLVISSRTWFCLYLFEHQYVIAVFERRAGTMVLTESRMSYGTGRPAILKDDESIWQCRLLLQHPLAIEDDMRLVSTVELMAIRERVHNNLSPLFDRAVDDITFNVLREADMEFRNWYATWDQAFSQKYEDAGEPIRDFVSAECSLSASVLSAEPSDPAPPRGVVPQRDRVAGH